jgi:hypothetical protein
MMLHNQGISPCEGRMPVWENSFVTFEGFSVGSGHNLIHEELGFSKVYTHWVPCELACEMKQMCPNMQKEESDKSWVHCFKPETKQACKK